MSEESRLGREAIEVSYALKQLISAGVRVFLYLENRERTLDSPIEKVMLSLQTMADEMERQKAAQRARDKAEQLARAGYVTGGRVFGYDLVDVMRDGSKRRRTVDDKRHPDASHVELAINEAEATVVRHIFRLAADGMGQRSIAMKLNLDGALTPMPRKRERSAAWATSSVHEVLFRTRYRGEMVWNRTKKRDRWGQHHPTDRHRDDWITVQAPHLRIVDDDLWNAAHARIGSDRGRTNARLGRKHSAYLLSGFARCAWCNGGVHVRIRTRGRDRADRIYGCTNNYNRGETVCRNNLKLPMAALDMEVMSRIRNIVTPNIVDDVIAGLRQALAPDRRDTLRDRLIEELAAAERQADNLTEAIARGGDIPALVARLRLAEEQRQRLAERIEQLEGGPMVTPYRLARSGAPCARPADGMAITPRPQRGTGAPGSARAARRPATAHADHRT